MDSKESASNKQSGVSTPTFSFFWSTLEIYDIQYRLKYHREKIRA